MAKHVCRKASTCAADFNRMPAHLAAAYRPQIGCLPGALAFLSLRKAWLAAQSRPCKDVVALALPLRRVPTTLEAFKHSLAENSKGALLAYKDLYRAADVLELAEGIAYEESTQYEIDDTEPRIAQFR